VGSGRVRGQCGRQRAICRWCRLGWSTRACGWVMTWCCSVHGVNAVVVVELTLAWPNMSNHQGFDNDEPS